MVRGATNTRGFDFPLARRKSGRRPLPLLCLAPHGVSHATPFTQRSGGLLPRLFNLAPLHFGHVLPFSPFRRSQSGAGRYIFCDTFRHLELTPQMPSLFARHAALWCSDFPLAQQGLRQRPPVTVLLIPRISGCIRLKVC